ncbi:hypothetical protein CB1_001068005 [Camelus ferus]|nr:hypothetical protein CB1_001068005 [Camelus ferus]
MKISGSYFKEILSDLLLLEEWDQKSFHIKCFIPDLENPQRHLFQLAKIPELNRCHQRELKCTRHDTASELRVNVQSASPTAAGQKVTSRPGDTRRLSRAWWQLGAQSHRWGKRKGLARTQARSVTLQAPCRLLRPHYLFLSPPAPTAAVPEANPTPPAAASAALELTLGPAPLGSAPLAEAALHSPPGPGGSWPGPETFRQRFQQFRYQDTAGPREAFRQLRELSRQWLRPDIRTKSRL